ncbi:surfeit locus 1 family protein [Rhizobium sp. NFR07]|uniref:SURF1 family protein n=1 Tax=Rhizobium sp. NFR07 TaxID=1566262 RepID=UPI0008E188DD|nr:SURF1 family protein [Rhizobium sp. NFR07]SFA92221.1 surfeit locus 1 family protein [Rhizobium sp. NFR07]
MEKPAKSHLALRAFLLFAALVFIALGSWQIQRLFWKLNLIARVDARVHAEAVAPPARAEWNSLQPSDVEYRHVALKGTFDHNLETLVQAVTERGAGFWVLTPLTQADGATIIVNRGFVPQDRRDPQSRAEGQIGGEVSVSGLLRLNESGGAFLRSNDPAKGNWYSRDVVAIAEDKRISNAAPYFVDADATANPGGLPVGGLTVVQFRNSHLVYALTWFTLAIMSLVLTAMIPRLLTRDP